MREVGFFIILSSTFLCVHAVAPVPHNAQGVASFFAQLEQQKSYIPNILELPPDEFSWRIEQMSSSVHRIISLLKYNPSKESYQLICRFFDMYALLNGKQVDFSQLNKNSSALIKHHELVFLRKQIAAFTPDMEKALMFVARNDDLSLQMGYDMMVVNTYFEQLFPPAAFPKASWWQETMFNLKHSKGTQKRVVNGIIVGGLTVGTYVSTRALFKERKERKRQQRQVPDPVIQVREIEKPVPVEVPVEVPSELNVDEQKFMNALGDESQEARDRLEQFILNQRDDLMVKDMSTNQLIRLAQMYSKFIKPPSPERESTPSAVSIEACAIGAIVARCFPEVEQTQKMIQEHLTENRARRSNSTSNFTPLTPQEPSRSVFGKSFSLKEVNDAPYSAGASPRQPAVTPFRTPQEPGKRRLSKLRPMDLTIPAATPEEHGNVSDDDSGSDTLTVSTPLPYNDQEE